MRSSQAWRTPRGRNRSGQTAISVGPLASQGSQAYSTLLGQTGANLAGTGNLLGSALQGAQMGMQNSLYGGWYGSDDGFVFGLFGGTVTHVAGKKFQGKAAAAPPSCP